MQALTHLPSATASDQDGSSTEGKDLGRRAYLRARSETQVGGGKYGIKNRGEGGGPKYVESICKPLPEDWGRGRPLGGGGGGGNH